MVTSDSPKIIVLGIDGLEYNLVEEWRLKNIMQKTYCKLDLSDYKVIVTTPIWGSMLTGKIDEEIMRIWVKRSEIMGGEKTVKQKWWAKFGLFLPPSVNLWLWVNVFEKFIGGDPFGRTANYILEKKELTIFQFFKNSWTNGIPSYGKNTSTTIKRDLMKQAILKEKTPYRNHVIQNYKDDKAQLFSVLEKPEIDFVFWYTSLLDDLGHIDMGRPVALMMKHYLDINEVVGRVKETRPDSIIYVISDHGMKPSKGILGTHSNHAFFSSNSGETIEKPFQLYNLISKHKSG